MHVDDGPTVCDLLVQLLDRHEDAASHVQRHEGDQVGVGFCEGALGSACAARPLIALAHVWLAGGLGLDAQRDAAIYFPARKQGRRALLQP